MDTESHREEQPRAVRRSASGTSERDHSSEQRDELAERRSREERSSSALTARERQERWPIG